MENKDGVFRYEFGDAEVEIHGYVLANSEEDAIKKARAACYITVEEVASGEEDVEVTHFMSKEDFERLVVTGEVRTFYDDWD
ncbi:hypothetical protein [Bacillus phage CM1]|nr:hypothetical protein [Bacillus phage vB_BtM_BMBsp2]WPF70139.1 hypothetical protein BCVP_CDS0111 [Bacillus phage BC-VP]BEU14580.1 hypothetical protein [Bacillus phage CM1]